MPEAKLSVVLHSVHIEIDPTLLERLNFLNNLPSFNRQSSNSNSFEKDARSLYLPMSNIQMVSMEWFVWVSIYCYMYICNNCSKPA